MKALAMKALVIAIIGLLGAPIYVSNAVIIPVTEIGNQGAPPQFPTLMGHVSYAYYFSDEITNGLQMRDAPCE